MSKGRTIRIFLADGTPGGIVSAEIMNWTGHVLFAPRSRLADLIQRAEARRTGVYFLTGTDPEASIKAQVYLGESDNVGKRLVQHNKSEESGGKDFWDRVCLVTSKDQNLTKAHVRYLESRLISITGELGRATVLNGTAPDYGYLPEADIADMEFFVDQIRIVLPVLGLDFLRERPKVGRSPLPGRTESNAGTQSEETDTQQDASPIFEIVSKKHGLRAEAKEVDGDFVVLANSTAQSDWIGDRKPNTHYWRLHDQLSEDGVLVRQNDACVFKDDYVFSSPSAAAAVIFGRSANGRTSWKVKGTNQTYADYQEQMVSKVSTETVED